MCLISQLEKNIYEYGDCTVKFQFEKANEAYEIRFVLNDDGLLDVHGFINVYDRNYWNLGNNTVNPKAKLVSNRYFRSFDEKEELYSILSLLVAKMIKGEPTCIDTTEGRSKANTKTASSNINRITSSMLNISNKELTKFYDMDAEEIADVLYEKPIMSIAEFFESDTLEMKCEDLMDRYNNIAQLQHTIHTDPDQININAARMMIYQLQNDESNRKVVVPKTYYIN